MEEDMKRIVTVIGALLLVIAVPATVLLTMRSQELRKKAAPATTLSLSPATISKAVGEEFTLEVRMNTGDNQIIAVQLNLIYDPTKLQADWIHNGTMFPNILTSGVAANGTITMALGATNTTTPITGTGTVATIKFTALAATTAPVSVRFAQDTFVGALNEGTVNALTSSTPATITIGSGSQVTPTPTTAAGITPTGSIFPTLTPTPTTSSSTPSAVIIETPLSDESVSTQRPVIEGKAPPGSTVTIVIHSDTEITATVVTDANGNWTYTVTQPLEPGPHTINVAAQNPTTGDSTTASLDFVVSTGNENGASGSAVPVSGAVENTLLLLGIGLFFIMVGFAVPLLGRREL